jgi:hypothetical protein
MNSVVMVDNSFLLDIVNALLDTGGVAAKMVCVFFFLSNHSRKCLKEIMVLNF